MDQVNNFQKIRHPKKRAMLSAYSETGNVSRAAAIAELDRSMHYTWVSKDSKYREAFEEAQGMAADALELEARRRAVDGVAEPVFYKGEKCGAVQKYSDTLLIFLMKGAMPDKYKERMQTDVKLDAAELTPEQADELIRAYANA